jgi:hypothetical protein
MPWFAVAYVTLLLAFGVYCFHDDRKEGRSAGYLATDAAVTALWIYFVWAYFHPPLAASLGSSGALPLLLGAVSWTAWDAWRELRLVIGARPEAYDPELSEAWNLRIDRGVETGAVLLGLLVMAPAIFCAMQVARRSW